MDWKQLLERDQTVFPCRTLQLAILMWNVNNLHFLIVHCQLLPQIAASILACSRRGKVSWLQRAQLAADSSLLSNILASTFCFLGDKSVSEAKPVETVHEKLKTARRPFKSRRDFVTTCVTLYSSPIPPGELTGSLWFFEYLYSRIVIHHIPKFQHPSIFSPRYNLRQQFFWRIQFENAKKFRPNRYIWLALVR